MSEAALCAPQAGDMARAVGAHDWRDTALGAQEGWSGSLRSLWALTVGSAQPMFLSWGAQGLFLYNDAMVPILGHRHPEALGRPSREVWSDCWSRLEPLFAAAASGRAVLEAALPLGLDEDTVLGEGLVSMSLTPVFERPQEVAGVLGVCTPIPQEAGAARLLEEERNQFSQLFAQSPTFMAMLNAEDYTIERANPGYLALVGGRAVVGKTVPEALPEAVSQGFVQILDRVRDTGAPFRARGMRYAPEAAGLPAGGERHLDFVDQPIKDQSGRVVRIFVEGADVTERALAEQGRADSEARLALALSGTEGVGVWDCC